MINLALIFYQRSHLGINNYGRNHCHVFVSYENCYLWRMDGRAYNCLSTDCYYNKYRNKIEVIILSSIFKSKKVKSEIMNHAKIPENFLNHSITWELQKHLVDDSLIYDPVTVNLKGQNTR